MTGEHKIEQNPEWGKHLARQFVGVGGAGDTLAIDPDRLRQAAQEIVGVAESASTVAEVIGDIGALAYARSSTFRSEYEPDGVYTNGYTNMEAGDGDVHSKLGLVVERAHNVAGGLQWLADKWEDVQAGNVDLTNSIDADITDGTGAGDTAPSTQPDTVPVSQTVEGSGALMDDVTDVQPA